jgi:hypothetical protein
MPKVLHSHIGNKDMDKIQAMLNKVREEKNLYRYNNQDLTLGYSYI